MPAETGAWGYRSKSVPPIDGLDGENGTFICERVRGANRFIEHGRVVVSKSGRFFEHADGVPFLWMGDTSWYGAILSSRSDWAFYLADHASKGFNVIHFTRSLPGMASRRTST